MTRLTLNESQRHTLLAGFRYIDKLLTEGAASAGGNGDDDAVFPSVVNDTTPVQRKIIADQLAHLRRALRAALHACDLEVPARRVSASWGLRSHLMMIEIALDDLGPRHLSGYGNLDAETAAGISGVLAQIRTALAELDTTLAGGPDGDLAARIARLDRTTGEVALLHELERIVTAHGLVEFRPALAQLIARLEINRWTVAFVGRVSCGKSSLLNFLLGTDALPTGVTPVTTVPIRIVHGAAAQATVSLAGAPEARIPAAQLGEFAAEERNRGNMRRVTDIELALPAPRLAGDVCFVDTPGLGSLATAGAAQTLAFLPRCDLGVVMIDASAVPTAEDLNVARALLAGGAEVLVVLSKADALTAADREKLGAYIAHEMAGALGQEVPVTPVSVAPGHAALAETWWDRSIAPRHREHRTLAAAALRRKIGALRDAILATLERRTGHRPARTSSPEILAALGAARAMLEQGRGIVHELPFRHRPAADEVLARAAARLAGAPPDAVNFSPALARELGRAAAEFATHFDAPLEEARDQCARALPLAAPAEAPLPAGTLLRPAGRPLFDPTPVLATVPVSAHWRRWPLAVLRRLALNRALQFRFAGPLEEALQGYGHALVRWSEHYLDDLTTQFNALAGPVEAVARPEGISRTAAEIAGDLDLLRAWPSRAALG